MAWALGDPDEGQRFFERALMLPYAQDTDYHRETADGIGRCHASRGEIEAARRLLTDARPAWVTHSLEPLLRLWDGDWDAIEALALRVIDTSRRNGNRWDEWASFHLAARVAFLRGEHERAGELLESALEIVTDGGADYFAMWVLPGSRARARGDRPRRGRARAGRALPRDRRIAARTGAAAGGIVGVAEAVVLAAEDADEAEAALPGRPRDPRALRARERARRVPARVGPRHRRRRAARAGARAVPPVRRGCGLDRARRLQRA